MEWFKNLMTYIWRRTHKPRETWKIMNDERKSPRKESQLLVRRKELSPISSISDLYYLNDYECRTLEDTWRDPDGSGQLEADEKVYGKTAIPVGRYRVRYQYSPSWKMIMPYLVDVPHYSGIMFHPGNRAVETKGCLLTGKTHAKDVVLNSKDAFIKITMKLILLCQQEEVWCEIINAEGEPFEKTE